jgi:hypothetical protein
MTSVPTRHYNPTSEIASAKPEAYINILVHAVLIDAESLLKPEKQMKMR